MNTRAITPLLALSALCALGLPASAQGWQWAQRGGGTASDAGQAVTVDSAGNVFITGSFSERARFGLYDLNSAGRLDVLVAKYDPGGDVLWAASGGGTVQDEGYGVAVDATGSVYVTGNFDRTATSGPFTLTSDGNEEAFLVKYSPEGEVLWARSGGGPAYDGAGGVVVDASGAVYVACWFWGDATFSDTTLTNAGNSDVFLLKYSPDGELLRAQRDGGSGGEAASGVAVDAAGNVYVTGYFSTVEGQTMFGPFTLESKGESDPFVVKYGPDGEVLWAASGGGVGRDLGIGIAVHPTGNALVIGDFESPRATFGGYTIYNPHFPESDVFIVRYSPEGDVLWAQRGGGSAEDRGHGVAVDVAGNAYVTGEFWGPATFGAHTLSGTGIWDIFVTKYAPDGDVIWAVEAGGTDSDRGRGVATDPAGNAFVTGNIGRSGARFGPFAFPSNGGDDVFVAMYGLTPVASEPGAPTAAYALSAAFPNPSTSVTKLTLTVPEAQHVRAEVFDRLGRRVAVLHDGLIAAGSAHALVFEGPSLPSGLYVVRVTGERFWATRRIALVR